MTVTPLERRFDVTIANEINLDLILYGLPEPVPFECDPSSSRQPSPHPDLPGTMAEVAAEDLPVGCLASSSNFHLSSLFLQPSAGLPKLLSTLKQGRPAPLARY